MSAQLESLIGADRRAECIRNDLAMQSSVRTFTRAARMVTTPAGITIGIAHQPKPQPMGSHAEAIQAALLEPRTAQEPSKLKRLLGTVWGWL